ncbi:8-amino-7-oxononanoate synthase [Rheinheimera baltica]|uniref:aminotransferase class I/II-fold pyridoxal phosphate-dependent enzyme n=1 Tax=Rheinheimera baltica TaxID=67576 RepID=UPI00273EBC9D|nr:8-amino-7-oxononanoate synthase [Rheinheimera baltica]MDP5143395.1 8-amino-7-oxononanoate synthase [Rheinheimera baltica]
MQTLKLQRLKQALDARAEQHLLRTPQTLQQYNGRVVTVADNDYLNFCGNDYLGLATAPQVLQAYADGALKYGAGSTGSPLVTGQHDVHQQLSEQLCEWLGAERVLLFSSGFSANHAMLTTLCDKHDTLLLDKLSHASLIDGALHSSALFKRFAHNDYAGLSTLLQRHAGAMVVTEGVFSMDGDSPDLNTVSNLCQKNGAMLLLDDAHGLGVFGTEGRGTAAEQGVRRAEVFCTMANFGKALGVGGAFVAGSKTVIDYLEQFGRHYVYSTALSPALCAAVIASIHLCRADNWRRDKLHCNISLFRRLASDLPLLASSSAIQGLVLGSSEKALALSQKLKTAGIWLSAIRPPTVPQGSARLRITLSAQHEEADIKLLVQTLRQSL